MADLLALLLVVGLPLGVALAAWRGVVLTGRAALLAAVGVLAVVAVPDGRTLVAVELLVLLAVVVDVALAGPVAPLQLSRDGGTSTRLGVPVTVGLTLRNTTGRRLRGRLRDAWPPSAGASPAEHRLDVPPGGSVRVETVLVPTRRGDRRPASVTVRRHGPLGVAGRQGSHALPWSVRVLPPFTSRRFLPERLSRLRQLEGAAVAPVRGQGTEFDSLREYVPGDDARSVDHRASARRSTVVVRTWRPERDRRVLLVLDTSRTSAGRVGTGDDAAPRLDAALDAALLLAALAGRAGDRVEAVALDVAVRASVPASGGDVLARLSSALAPLEPALVEADARLLVSEVLRRAPQRSLVVLLTDLAPASMRAGLLPVLGPLVDRHVLLLAAVHDPRVEELARGRAGAAEVYGAAAAEAAAADRRRLVAELRRRGVQVVDAPPDRLAPALADTYLDLKAAGRL